jgi:tetratricopeptide (TPR) repeat protein
MMRQALAACAVILLAAGGSAFACVQNPADKPAYTTAEYNAFGAATNEPAAASRVKLLDDFVSKYPQSTLLCYIYQSYFVSYNELKNHGKVIEYADKMLEFGDKFNATQRYQAYYFRAVSFLSSFVERTPGQEDKANKARAAAREGLHVLGEVPKPENVTDERWAQEKKHPTYIFNYLIGIASMYLKEYPAALEGFQGALAMNPSDGVSLYRTGLAYLQMAPPQQMDGFWSLARAINLKVAGEAQVRAYLRNQLLRYQNPQCDKEIDAQMTELLGLAAGAAERPADYRIPASADLEAIQKDLNIITLMNGLKAGGDTTKKTWLAACSLEFPEVIGKVIEVAEADGAVIMRVYTGADEKEVQDATVANMEVKITEQPEAARVKKDDAVRFSGALARFAPDPFLIHWEKGKVNPEDIPEAEVPTKKAKTPAKKSPARKSPTKRPPA